MSGTKYFVPQGERITRGLAGLESTQRVPEDYVCWVNQRGLRHIFTVVC